MAFDPWIYDTNKDCYIDVGEATVALHDYTVLGTITESQWLQVLNLWQNSTKNPACEVTTGWQLLKSIDITLKPPAEVGGWNLLATIDVTLKPPVEVGGWNLLETIDVTLTPTGFVPECSTNADCPSNKPYCVGGVCVQCRNDADCPEGYECKSGVCVKKGAAFPWQWLAIVGAAIAGVLLLIPKPKKAKEKIK